MPESSHVNDIRIVGVYQYPTDPTGSLQSNVGPGLAPVGRLVHALTDRYIGPDKALAGTYIDHLRIGGSNSYGANRVHLLLIKNRSPGEAAIDGFPYATTSCTYDVGQRVARNSRHGINPVANWADMAGLQLINVFGF